MYENALREYGFDKTKVKKITEQFKSDQRDFDHLLDVFEENVHVLEKLGFTKRFIILLFSSNISLLCNSALAIKEKFEFFLKIGLSITDL